MKDEKIECTVNGMLKGGAAMCGHVMVGCKYCTLKLGECNLQKGVKPGAANGVLQKSEVKP